MLFPLELIYLALPPSFVLFHLSVDQIPVAGIFPSSVSIAGGGFKSQLIDIPSHSLPSLSNSFVLFCLKCGVFPASLLGDIVRVLPIFPLVFGFWGSVSRCHLCPSLFSSSSSPSDGKVLLALRVSSLSGLIRSTVVNIKYI